MNVRFETNRKAFNCVLLGSLFAAVSLLPARAERAQVPFRGPEWNLSSAVGSKLVEHNGRESLYVERGIAVLNGIDLSDGVIEVDVTTPNARAFAGIAFHVQSSQEYEETYIRLHKSGSPDAVQYAPVFNGVTSWQLHGPGDGWAAASFDKNRWVPLRLDVEGANVRIFVGDAPKPALVSRLRRERRGGSVGVSAVFGAYFSNFRYTPRPAATDVIPEPETPLGTITQWEISSQSFEVAADRRRLEQVPSRQERWTSVRSEPTGLLNISRYHKSPNMLPESGQQILVGTYARVTIDSDRAQLKKLLFGYSDDVVIFLNDRPVFTGKSGFRSRDPLFQGVIGYHDAVFLDLRKGANDLVFAVADGFGGWGLMARLEDSSGTRTKAGDSR